MRISDPYLQLRGGGSGHSPVFEPVQKRTVEQSSFKYPEPRPLERKTRGSRGNLQLLSHSYYRFAAAFTERSF
jgi:hypothetical protein